MIFYGVCIGSDEKYRRCAVPGLEFIGGLDRTMESRDNDSIFTAYNRMLDEVRGDPDLEALVLLHEDLELRDSEFEAKLRSALDEPDVAVAGAIGGRGVRGVRWSRADQTFGRMPDAYYGDNDYGRGSHDVDIVDGCILVLSPWAVRNLRFDQERFHGFHAYDADFCMQARAEGKLVVTFEFDAFHHTKGGLGDAANHQASDALFREKWGIPSDPLHRRLRDAYPIVERAKRAVLRR